MFCSQTIRSPVPHPLAPSSHHAPVSQVLALMRAARSELLLPAYRTGASAAAPTLAYAESPHEAGVFNHLHAALLHSYRRLAFDPACAAGAAGHAATAPISSTSASSSNGVAKGAAAIRGGGASAAGVIAPTVFAIEQALSVEREALKQSAASMLSGERSAETGPTSGEGRTWSQWASAWWT
jgi:hypothetical protein